MRNHVLIPTGFLQFLPYPDYFFVIQQREISTADNDKRNKGDDRESRH